MSCSQCKNLQKKEKKPGKVMGAKYFCKKKKKYVNGANPECPKFSKSYARTNDEKNEIYLDGKNFYDDDTNIGAYLVILIILIILAIIVNIFH
ncbi:MAG: hypothetical protein IJF92_03695 [Bacilli bacterium]|nr:hypothetical protein [Bacilli bacterium]